MADYAQISKDARKTVLRLIYEAQTSHIGSNFSCIDILTVLFEKVDIKQDEVILSKGWAAAAWYYFLWRKGIITEEELNSFCQEGSKFIGLVEPMNRWGLRFAGGSMGYGLPAAVGFALSKKLKGEEGKVYCLISDGELQIGTFWESLQIVATHQLHNLVVICDNNGFQAMGKTSDILTTPAKGFFSVEIDGHDYMRLEEEIKGGGWILANTVKGKGVSFMENNNDWHYRNLDKTYYDLAKQELG